MVKSMTGFGRAEKIFDTMEVTVEIKSVNHRYFEFSSRVPRNYAFLEEKLKSFLKEKISRGKVEVYVTINNSNDDAVEIEVDRFFADGYVKALKSLAKLYGVKNDITASVIARNSDVFNVKKKSVDEEAVTNRVLETTADAVSAFVSMREAEGAKLKEDVLNRTNFILEKVSFVEERSPETVKQYRDRLYDKIKELLSDAQVDEQRLITETAIFADKVAVAEETVRLRSHIAQLTELLNSDDAVGRKLDFLIQEMNREANTIGSKAQDIDIAHTVVDIKSEIEKIREQIQNIE